MSICDKCGHEIDIGCWPFCPHGRVDDVAVQSDVLPGGPRWMHNLDHNPIWVETKTQLRHELSSRGLVLADRARYNRRDDSPWATRKRLKPGRRDPFVHRTGHDR